MTTTTLTIAITLMALSMFFIKQEYKILVLWFSLMCCSQFPEVQTVGVLLNVPTCFFISEIRNIRLTLRYFNQHWLSFILTIIIIATIILYFASPHCYNGGLKGALSLFVFELVRKYFFLLYALVTVTGLGTFESLLKVTKIAILILTIFGIQDLIVGHSVYNEFLVEEQQDASGVSLNIIGDNFREDGRWHIHSLFRFSFDYGFTCLVSLLICLFGLAKDIVTKKQCLIIVICSLFGIIMCGCRSVWISAVIAIMLYMLLRYSFGRGGVIIISLSFLFVVLYNTIPQVQKFYALAGSAFEEETNYGSSLSQRQRSYDAVLLYWQNNKVFGNGKDFFFIDLKYGEGETINKDLAGLEGVMMNLLLERGLVGVVAYLIFYVALLIKIHKLRYADKEAAACAFTIIIAYILYANFTGELKSVPPTLFMAGALLKLLFLAEENQRMEALSKDVTEIVKS